MSWNYEYFNVSGYTTGVTGIQINESLYLQVSGLSYDGTTFTNEDLEYLTGVAFLTSGITEISGSFFYNAEDKHWESILSVSDIGEIGNQGTGTFEFNYNSGAVNTSTADTSTGVAIFANASSVAWDALSNTDGSVDNADDQHSHVGGGEGMNDLVDDETPQLGGDLDTAGNSINDDTGDDIVDINDDLNVQGNITLDGTVDGVDIATRDHDKYVDAEAVAAVEAAGLTLDSTKVITSADENLAFIFGRNQLGVSGDSKAFFGYRGITTTNYGFKQNSSFLTSINSPTGGSIFLNINNVEKANIDVNGLELGNANARVTTILDEDAMGSDSATALATQQSIKKYVDDNAGGGVDVGAGFPGAPDDGDLHYNTGDETLYMWSDDAAAWVMVGGAGSSGASIAVGTYTGDGVGDGVSWAALKSITGFGFRPKFVYIFGNFAIISNAQDGYTIIDAGNSDMALRHVQRSAGGGHQALPFTVRITADGFDVADLAANNNPNASGVVYRYYAIG